MALKSHGSKSKVLRAHLVYNHANNTKALREGIKQLKRIGRRESPSPPRESMRGRGPDWGEGRGGFLDEVVTPLLLLVNNQTSCSL